MPIHKETRVLSYAPERFFDLVADVEQYPEFLPLWRQAKVYHREGALYYTDQEIGLGPVRERFRSKTVLRRPVRIDVTSSEQIFRRFEMHWQFVPTASGGCQVSFILFVEARPRLLRKVLDTMLVETSRRMVLAFERRAHQLYGGSAG
jgi:coenzyme Q-binding protein COQ10